MVLATIKHVAVTYHPHLGEAAALAPEVSSFLTQSGVETTSGLLSEKAVAEGLAEQSFDLLVALGGDGMMLRCVHACAPGRVPIVGINLGRFGFLAEFRREEWREGLGHILRGDCWVERRMMLHAEHYRASEKLGEWEVLNDCVVARGRVMRLLQFSADVDGQPLATYSADGLIAATATGSTAYALAAGGPILPPELRNILLMPVAPHLSMDRGIVLPEGSTASITVHTDHEALLSCDGQASERMDNGDRLLVSSGRYEAKFLRVQGRGYFFRNMMSRMKRNS
ncbi:MAG: NAD(+)/NADH kinase [Anaerolineales bacterium]|jgi:NAD+ kinase